MPPAAARPTPRPLPPWLRQARWLVHCIDGLAVVYGALFVGALLLVLLVDHPSIRLHPPFAVQVPVAGGDQAAALPAALEGRLRLEGSHALLRVTPTATPALFGVALLRAALTATLIWIGYRAVRALAAGFAQGAAFTHAGALWTRRLGSFGMITTVGGLVLGTLWHALASRAVEQLARQLPDLERPAYVVDGSPLVYFPLFFFLWLLGGAMHRAAEFEQQSRDTV